MHMLIGVITYGTNKEDAYNAAVCALDTLAGEGKPFDYYGTPEEKGEYIKIRYGFIPRTIRVKTKTADRWLKQLMGHTFDEFKSNLAGIRRYLKTGTIESLIGCRDFRYKCLSIGQYRGPNVWLYTAAGDGIRDQAALSKVITIKGFEAWLTLADVHF